MWNATVQKLSPSYRFSMPNLAPQMRVAWARMVSKTGCKSPGELDMTRSTSGGGRLLLQRLGELLLQLGAVFADMTNARSHLRSGRTKLATMRSALRPLARQGHLVGTVIGRLAVGQDRAVNPNRTAMNSRLFDHLVLPGTASS